MISSGATRRGVIRMRRRVVLPAAAAAGRGVRVAQPPNAKPIVPSAPVLSRCRLFMQEVRGDHLRSASARQASEERRAASHAGSSQASGFRHVTDVAVRLYPYGSSERRWAAATGRHSEGGPMTAAIIVSTHLTRVVSDPRRPLSMREPPSQCPAGPGWASQATASARASKTAKNPCRRSSFISASKRVLKRTVPGGHTTTSRRR